MSHLIILSFFPRTSKELSPLKSTLAKQWGARKAAYTKRVAKTTGEIPASDLIHEAEVSFLQSCVSDLQQALRAWRRPREAHP